MRFFLLLLLILPLSLATSFISNCTEISKPGDYVIANDLYFVKASKTYENPGDVCLRITSHNVNLDCNGHSIVGSNENKTYGIYTYNIQNFSVKNCNVSSFGICVYLRDSYNISIDRNSFSCLVHLGDFPVNSTSEVSLTNNLFVNSSLNDEMPANITVINNTFSEGGLFADLDSNSVIFGNTFYFSSSILVNHSFSYCSALYSSGIGIFISNNSFSDSCFVSLQGKDLIFSNNYLSSTLSYNGLDVSRLKNSKLINNTICSSGANRSASYTSKYFDLYGAWPGGHNEYANNTCDTSDPQHICTKSCAGSDTLSKSNCPFSFVLAGLIFLAFLRGKN